MPTYKEMFPPGTRVKVNAAMRREGTDHEWHGHAGTVVKVGMWIAVKMDKHRRHWPRGPVYICGHNLQAITTPDHPSPAAQGE